jgi:hypothetical protein
MTSAKKQHRRISPMPVVSSFPPPDRTTVHSEVTTYVLTEEQLAEVIAKYGPPTRPYGSYSSITSPPKGQQGGGKHGKKQVRIKKDAS